MLIDIKEVVLPKTNEKIWVLIVLLLKDLNKIIRPYTMLRKQFSPRSPVGHLQLYKFFIPTVGDL